MEFVRTVAWETQIQETLQLRFAKKKKKMCSSGLQNGGKFIKATEKQGYRNCFSRIRIGSGKK